MYKRQVLKVKFRRLFQRLRGNGAKYSCHRPQAAKFLALERYAIGDALQERVIPELFIDWLFRQTESCSLTAAFIYISLI